MCVCGALCTRYDLNKDGMFCTNEVRVMFHDLENEEKTTKHLGVRTREREERERVRLYVFMRVPLCDSPRVCAAPRVFYPR